MHKELEQCIGELRVNHTDREIAGALSEYFQIVKNVSYEYTDNATVAELRTDHPELAFMDDDEIEEILEQAKTMRHKREVSEEKHLTEGDVEELFKRNRDWGDGGSDRQRAWIRTAALHDMTTIEELAGMVWVCTESVSIDCIERTMREYLEEKREKERSTDWSADGYDVGFAEECIKAHMDAFCIWPYGDVKKIEMDEDGDLRVRYVSGMYWHYRKTENGDIEWW